MRKNKRFYRNTEEIMGVEPGCLWKLMGEHFVLVDDDTFIQVEVKGNEQKFGMIKRDDPCRILSFLFV